MLSAVQQPNKNVMVAIERNAITSPDAPALEYGTRRLTYSELLDDVYELAVALTAGGIGRQSVVMILGLNTDGFVKLWMASSHLGAIFTPINYRLAAAEIAHLLNVAPPDIVFVDDELVELMASAMEIGNCRVDVVVLTDGQFDREWMARAGGAEVPPVAIVDDAHIHRLVFTSGTTGYPKGAMLSHGNVVAKNMIHTRELAYRPSDGALVCGPMYHVGAFDSTATTLFHVGGFVSIQRTFVARDVIERASRSDITVIWLAPVMIHAILRSSASRRTDLSGVRVIISGGEKIPEPLIAELAETFPNAWFADAYGLTESVSAVTLLERRQTSVKLGSVGRPVAYTDLRISDAEGHEVGPNVVGEVLVRSEMVFEGYWQDEAATKEALRGDWLHTQDLGYRDDDGYLFIVDRLKDMIRSGSENVASLEVERVLYEHEAVEVAAVVGRPHLRWGEVPWAFIVARSQVTEQDLLSFCAARLARFKVPGGITFVDDLPRNPSGKILKRALREQLAADGTAPSLDEA